MTSAVLIVPVALRPAADAVGAAMGWGEGSYTIPLSADGEAVTHFACRADVSAGFLTLIAAALDGNLPPHLPPEAATVIAALIVEFSTTLWGEVHLLDVLARHGLQRAD